MIIEIIYKWRLDELEKHKRDSNIIYVNDLIRCPLKRKYEMLFPEMVKRDLINPISITGSLIHIGIESVIYDYLKETYEIHVETEITKLVKISEKEIIIKGRPDLVMVPKDQGKGTIVVEFKSTRSDTSIPYPHHLLQTQIYSWMIEAKEAYLVYITPERITEYKLSDFGKVKLSDDEIKKLIEETINLISIPRYPWECKYCIFSAICHKKVITT